MISYRYGQGGIKFRQSTISRSGIASEFNDSGSHSLGEFYRNRGRVDSSISRGRSGLSLRYDPYMKYNVRVPRSGRVSFSSYSQAARLVENYRYIGSHRPSQFIYWRYAPGNTSSDVWGWHARKLAVHYVNYNTMRAVPHLRVWASPVGFYIRGDRKQQRNIFIYGKRRRAYTRLRRLSVRYPGIDIFNQPDRFANRGGYARYVGRRLPTNGYGIGGRWLHRSYVGVQSTWNYDGRRFTSNSSLAIGGRSAAGSLGNERGYFTGSRAMVYSWPIVVYKFLQIDVYQRRLLFNGLWSQVRYNFFWTDAFNLYVRN